MRPHYTPEDIVGLIQEHDVNFIRLQFTDIHGVIKNVEVTASQLDKVLNNELMFDGSAIEGFTRVEESDMYLRPDLSTFAVFPWMPKGIRTARFICDVYNPDGTPFTGCPRYALRKAIKEASEMGYTMNVGPEAEFFLFQKVNGQPTTIAHDRAGYFDLAPIEAGEDIRRDMVLVLEQMGFEIETAHHEVADGQSEIDFKYSDVLTTADNIQTFKLVVRTVAAQHGVHATFLPKPIYGINGSGMHCNQSLFKNGCNAFWDPNGDMQLSDDCRYYIGGLLKHARAYTAITNPLINSYKRLIPGYEAPVYVSWSGSNRSPLIRIPAKRGLSTRVELRSPDPACNPYLALAVMLKAGLDGIKNKIDPGKAVDLNIYDIREEERQRFGMENLPSTLKEAIDNLEQSEFIKEALGHHIYQHFREAKLREWDEYSTHVHQWEIDRYLSLY